jgi:hypothetical protein
MQQLHQQASGQLSGKHVQETMGRLGIDVSQSLTSRVKTILDTFKVI